jgi:2-hydroxychromene-2-carboxylate isomerase
MKKEKAITIGAVILIILIAGVVIYMKGNSAPQTSTEIVQCIGKNSILYVQTGCSHCKDQEDLFGNNTQYLNMIDCIQIDQRQKCIDAGIRGTPTWIIKNQSYVGVQTIEKLKQLTGC